METPSKSTGQRNAKINGAIIVILGLITAIWGCLTDNQFVIYCGLAVIGYGIIGGIVLYVIVKYKKPPKINSRNMLKPCILALILLFTGVAKMQYNYQDKQMALAIHDLLAKEANKTELAKALHCILCIWPL